MYLDASGHEVPNPDPAAGLYIRDRSGHMVRAGIPADCIAFQVRNTPRLWAHIARDLLRDEAHTSWRACWLWGAIRGLPGATHWYCTGHVASGPPRTLTNAPMLLQVGEALQIHSGGLLQATPHFVRSARGVAAAGVSRNTFAVFMQPNVDERMDCPPGV